MKFIVVILLSFAAAAGAATPDQNRALADIEAFTVAQQKSDPLYKQIEDELLKRIDALIASKPPADWAPTVKRWYFAESEKAHAAERAKIREAELSAAGGVFAPSPAAADRYIERMDALEKDLLAGKLGPREHALHALEAARAIYPDDAVLIALRERKVFLATAYELGQLSRGQYDERWAAARAQYQQAASAREAALRSEISSVGAQAPGKSWGQILREQRGVQCTSTPDLTGRSVTTICR